MSHLVFEVLQAKIEKKVLFFFFTDFVYQYTCINTFFFTDFVYQYTCINTFFFLFLTDLSVTGQKRKRLYEHIGNLDRLSKKGRKVIGETCSEITKTVDEPLSADRKSTRMN